MHKVALVLACLASVSDGRRAQGSAASLRNSRHAESQNPSSIINSRSNKQVVACGRSLRQLHDFAVLLFAFNPAGGVSPVLRPSQEEARPAASGGAPVQRPAGGWFDGASLGACVVRQRGPNDWVMWYAGRSTDYAADVIPIATGCVGLAVSEDGLSWHALAGGMSAGSVLEPSRREGDFDTSHVAVGDVVISSDGQYTMYMFGGDDQQPQFGTKSLPRGTVMRIGLAKSVDGKVWERVDGAILEPSNGQVFVGWPQLAIVPSGDAENTEKDRHLLYYHALQQGKFEICVAEPMEPSGHGEWRAHGCCLQAMPGTFYAGGVSARCVVPDPDPGHPKGSLLMFFEAQDESRRHSIGLARSNDGFEWTVMGKEPVFQPAEDPDAWDGAAVARPWLVPMKDGSARLYYLGRSTEGAQAIGVAESVGADWTNWRRL